MLVVVRLIDTGAIINAYLIVHYALEQVAENRQTDVAAIRLDTCQVAETRHIAYAHCILDGFEFEGRVGILQREGELSLTELHAKALNGGITHVCVDDFGRRCELQLQAIVQLGSDVTLDIQTRSTDIEALVASVCVKLIASPDRTADFGHPREFLFELDYASFQLTLADLVSTLRHSYRATQYANGQKH